MTKRFLSLLLVLCLLFTLLPAAIAVDDAADREEHVPVSEEIPALESELSEPAETVNSNESNEPEASGQMFSKQASLQVEEFSAAPLSAAGSVKKLYFDEEYQCEIGATFVVSPYYFSETRPEQIIWSCSDSWAVSFSETSVLNDPTAGDNQWFIAVTVKALRSGSFTLNLNVDGVYASAKLKITNSVRKGVMTEVGDDYVKVDGWSFSLGGCSIYGSLSDVELPADVLYQWGTDGIGLARIAAVESLIVPTVSISATPDSFTYQNGAFLQDSMEAKLTVSCQQKMPFFSDRALSELTGLSTRYDTVTFMTDTEKMNFGTEGHIFKSEIKKEELEGKTLYFRQSATYTVPVYVRDKYVPASITEAAQITAKLEKDGKEINAQSVNVFFANLDREAAQRAAIEQEAELAKPLKTMRENLEQSSAIALDAGLLEYFSDAQVSEMEDYLVIYCAKIMTMLSENDKTFLEKVDERIQKKVEDKLFSILHLSKSTKLFARKTEAATTVMATTKDGESAKLRFYITLNDYVMGENDPYASTAEFRIEVDFANSNDIEIPVGGMLTLVNLKSFAQSMVEYIKIAYDEAWGKDANKVAAMFDAKPIDALLDGDYSGAIYRTCTTAAESSVKVVSIHCPVDVYVYDESGSLAAKVVDDTVDLSCQGVAVSVNGSEKTLRFVGGEYRIELQGTDAGEMQYTVQEFRGNETVRTLKVEVPLKSGTSYCSLVPDGWCTDAITYTLEDSDGEIIPFQSEETVLKDSPPYDYTLWSVRCGDSAFASLDRWGTLKITGTGAVNGSGDSNRAPDWWPWYTSYREAIKTIEIEEGITELEPYAFGYRYGALTNLETIVIPDSVKAIREGALYGAQSLKRIYIGAGLKTIDSWVFTFCNQIENIHISAENPYFVFQDGAFIEKRNGHLIRYLRSGQTSIEIPDGVCSIEPDSMGDMTELESVTIPSSVYQIDYYAFDGSNALKTICGYDGTAAQAYAEKYGLEFVSLGSPNARKCGYELEWSLRNGVLQISGQGEMYEFDDYSVSTYAPWSGRADEVERVEIGNGITTIGANAFRNCKNLVSISMPSSVTRIGKEAFTGCSKLPGIVIPGTVSVVDAKAFENCASLVDLTIQSGVSEIGQYAFSDCESLKQVSLPSSVTVLGEDVFYRCSRLERVNLPENITTIPSGLFSQCTNLNQISVPAGLEVIGSMAFYQCKNLEHFALPDTLTALKYGAFEGCESLNGITIPESVTEIGTYVFSDCKSLTDITIPYGITKVENNLFSYCSSLTHVSLPDSITSIGEFAFYSCESLENITLPAGVTKIGNQAFRHCSSLKYVTLPEPLTSIGEWAFSACSCLTDIEIPKEVSSIERGAFAKCEHLESINVVADNPNYCSTGGILYSKDGTVLHSYPGGKPTTAFEIPKTVSRVEDFAFFGCLNLKELVIRGSVPYGGFEYCENLEKVRIDDGITCIDYYAFNECNGLKTVVIPVSVTAVKWEAFYRCNNLTDVYYAGTQEQWNAVSIDDNNQSLTNAAFHYQSSGETTPTGWQKEDGYWHYYNDEGVMQTGWLKQDGKWYFLDSSGVMRKGWVKTGGKWYYMNSSGVMQTGWQEISGKKYYFASSGAMVTGLQTIGGKKYYFDANGAMQTGWQDVSGKRYYFQTDGSAKTGWVKSNGSWYYMDANGAMMTGWVQVNNVWYYFNAKGVMQTGWQKISDKWYYMDELGSRLTGWVYLEPDRYYMDENGVMQTGWVKLDGKWYYFNSSGKMVTGWASIGGKWYYFNADGVMQTGWVKSNSKWYYMNSSGAMATGLQTIGGKQYYFNAKGVMQTGWQEISGKKHYFASSGEMKTGWQKIDSKWYYFNADGVMRTGWLKSGGKWYYMEESGVMHTGWLQLKDKWYYMDSKGVMVTGTQVINGKTRTFDDNGVWLGD